MNLQTIVENISNEETLDFKELLLTLFGDEIDLETIYTQIKDTN